MIHSYPIWIDGAAAIAIEVKLPKTNLLMVTTQQGYIMCGALDIALLNDRLKNRGIIAGRAVGVKTIDELLHAPLESVTIKAEEMGITAGTTGVDALKMLLKIEQNS